MHITLLQIAETKDPSLRHIENSYLKKIKPFCSVEAKSLKIKNPYNSTEKVKIKNLEGQKILSQCSNKSFIIALSENGQTLSSQKFANFLEEKLNRSLTEIVFIIGGPFGLGAEVLKKAHFIFSLSSLTFTHEMTRIILLEQIYRAFTIIRGQTYHY